MIFDTDVLIWFFRGNPNAIAALEHCDSCAISSITYMELLAGLRNKNELRRMHTLLTEFEVTIVHINERISLYATEYVHAYCLSHALKFPDALIAATGVYYSEKICTANYKHFTMIPNISLQIFRP